jgi:addiction module HigA family antidote
MNKLKPVTPGEILLEDFLKPMALSQYRLAKEIGVPAQRISEIVAGKRSITADTDLRLCRFFGLSNGYWLRAQAAHDTEVAERDLAATIRKIRPWATRLGRFSRCRSFGRLNGKIQAHYLVNNRSRLSGIIISEG